MHWSFSFGQLSGIFNTPSSVGWLHIIGKTLPKKDVLYLLIFDSAFRLYYSFFGESTGMVFVSAKEMLDGAYRFMSVMTREGAFECMARRYSGGMIVRVWMSGYEFDENQVNSRINRGMKIHSSYNLKYWSMHELL